eukprot:CAMPEP_0202953020 /NCGR_PEP_ID=MMETSP1395-20130829/42799_1 /ASSEMBLY_ACC=CAM_ASM_000871 /TAXON_ID=5961 /ORGANISM="Blepharisma japonicum, Strain Stock R1072" /LENGTH=95 /DNA_ID=CAMNT_0049665201 /DNA_START=23 /DNA_END=310 /DNA_ORIENTATION=+
MTEQMVEEGWYMEMEIFMTENESVIKLMGMEFISILMELNMMDFDKTTNSMVMASKNGLMAPYMKEATIKVKSMAQELLYEQTKANMKESSEITA